MLFQHLQVFYKDFYEINISNVQLMTPLINTVLNLDNNSVDLGGFGLGRERTLKDLDSLGDFLLSPT